MILLCLSTKNIVKSSFVCLCQWHYCYKNKFSLNSRAYFEVTLWDLSKPNSFFRNWGHKIIIDILLESSQVCSKFIRKGRYVFCQAYVYAHVTRKPRLLYSLALDLVGCMQLFLGFSRSNNKRKIWLKEKKNYNDCRSRDFEWHNCDMDIPRSNPIWWSNCKQHRFCILKDPLFNLSFYKLWHKRRVDFSREILRFSFLVSLI